jgi:enterochelin esterase-like enzyme
VPQTANGSASVAVNGNGLGSAVDVQAALAEQLNGFQLNGSRPHSDDAQAASLGGSAAATAAGTATASSAVEEELAGEPYSLVQRLPLAGGTLELIRLEGTRRLRVWLPPGYQREEAARRPLPLLLLHDGQNLFFDKESFSGRSWGAAETAATLIASGQLPPFIVAGIDHAGPLRSFDYLPYKPGTGPGGFRADAAKWPGGGVAAYMARVVDEILPWLTRHYGAASDPEHIALGGSSFGGICTLWAAMHYPGRFGAALVESPSLWFADERFLKEDLQQYEGTWPHRMYLAMGSKEFTGTRGPEAAATGAEYDRLLVGYCKQLAALLGSRGLGADRLKWEIGEGAAHTEAAWAERLPHALPFLLQHWWASAAQRHSSDLFFTSPGKLQAGQPAVLFVQKARSDSLAGSPGPLRANIGFNGWSLGSAELQLQPAPQLEIAASAAEGGSGVASSDSSGSGGSGSSSTQEPAWWCASFTVPEEAYEMQFVLTDGRGKWDNNAGNDFYLRCKLWPSALHPASQSPEQMVAAAQAAVEGPADGQAARNSSKLFFTAPETLVAGAPAVLYLNRARSGPLHDKPNVRAHLGFNHWAGAGCDLQLLSTSLQRGPGVDWWATQPFQVPEDSFDLSFAFTDGHGCWDNNDGLNFSLPVLQPAQGKQRAQPRTIASVEVVDHAGGKLHIIQLSRGAGSDRQSKEARWTEEKMLRVWTPAGWTKEGAPPGGWPVLWMNDGQNMFEDHLAHQGAAWNVGYCAAHLIGSGVLPPFVVAAVDSAGPMRSLNLLPYKPGTGQGGFRGDAERWPGGGCDAYLRRLQQDLMPLVQTEFNTSVDPSKTAFGGGSFAGVTALYAAMHCPHVFGAVLAESPSLWIAEGKFLEDDLKHYRGPLPERIFIGCGTKEYSATRDHERPDVDAYLLHQYCEAAAALEAAGMRGPQRLRFLVEEEAGHHEKAWAWRLSGALTFLLSPWWDA